MDKKGKKPKKRKSEEKSKGDEDFDQLFGETVYEEDIDGEGFFK